MLNDKFLTITEGEDMKQKMPIQIGLAFNITINLDDAVKKLVSLENSIQSIQNSISNDIPHQKNKFIEIDWQEPNSIGTENPITSVHCDAESKNKFDGGGTKQITDRQKDTIRSMCEKREYDPEKYSIDCIGKKLDELCGSEANKLIKSLKGVKNE